MLHFIFGFTYFGVALTSSSSQTLRTALLTLLCLFQCMKALQMFSVFKSSRVLLRIVIEMIKDMAAFMLFMLATTLTVSLIFTAAIPDDSLTNATYSDYLFHVYLLDFGDFSLDDYSAIDTAIFILSAVIVGN